MYSINKLAAAGIASIVALSIGGLGVVANADTTLSNHGVSSNISSSESTANQIADLKKDINDYKEQIHFIGRYGIAPGESQDLRYAIKKNKKRIKTLTRMIDRGDATNTIDLIDELKGCECEIDLAQDRLKVLKEQTPEVLSNLKTKLDQAEKELAKLEAETGQSNGNTSEPGKDDNNGKPSENGNNGKDDKPGNLIELGSLDLLTIASLGSLSK